MLVDPHRHDLKPGQHRKGPDYYMSSESGHAPVIYRSLGGGREYIVCHEGDLDEAIKRNGGLRTPNVATSNAGRVMRFYIRLIAAEARYLAMCQAQASVNRKLHQRSRSNKSV